MLKLEIDKTKDFHYLLKKIKESKDSDLYIIFKKDVGFYKNSLNLIVAQNLAESLQKSVRFDVENPKHKDYIEAVNANNIEYTDEQINLVEHGELSSLAECKFHHGKTSKFSMPSFRLGSLKARLIVMPIAILLVLTSLLFAFWWYVPTSVINLSVDSDVLVKLIDVKAVVGSEDISVESATIPAFKVEITETDSQTIPTTGKKTIGKKAKGSITITNKTTGAKKIEKDTTIKLISGDKENLRYVTTEEIEVGASEESGDGSGLVYGKKTVEIEAKEAGDKYNLDEDQQFQIDDTDTDDLVGDNEDDLSGGYEEEISVVAQTDIDSLRRSVNDFMYQKITESLKKSLVEGQSLQESTVTFVVQNADYSNKADEEAEELTLTSTAKGEGLAYDKKVLDELVGELVVTIVPDQYSLDDETPEYEVAAVKSKTEPDTIDIQVKLRSSITPKIDDEKIKQDIVGAKIGEVQDYLDSLDNIKSYSIDLSPQLPGFLRTMPHKISNIVVKVE